MDDFINIGQTQEELNVDIGIDGDSGQIVDLHSAVNGVYPSMVVYGVRFNDTLKVLKEKCRDSYRSFDVWVYLDGVEKPVNVGKLPADINTFLIMRYLHLTVALVLDENTIKPLDLNNPEELELFI